MNNTSSPAQAFIWDQAEMKYELPLPGVEFTNSSVTNCMPVLLQPQVDFCLFSTEHSLTYNYHFKSTRGILGNHC